MDLTVLSHEDLQSTLLDRVLSFLLHSRTKHVFQHPGMADVVRRTLKCDVLHFIGFSDDEIEFYGFGVVDHWRTRLFRSIHFKCGPVCDSSEGLVEWIREMMSYLRARRFVNCSIHPYWLLEDYKPVISELEKDNWVTQHTGGVKSTNRIDISPSEDEILGSFRKTTRYEIRKAIRAGVQVLPASSEEDLTRFHEVHLDTCKRKRLVPESLAFFLNIYHLVRSNPGMGELLLVNYGDRTVGGIIVLRLEEIAWYCWGATLRLPDLNIGHVLQYHGMLWAKEHGSTLYDLGGLNTEKQGSVFKLGFSKDVLHFHPGAKQILRPGMYRMMTLLGRIIS